MPYSKLNGVPGGDSGSKLIPVGGGAAYDGHSGIEYAYASLGVGGIRDLAPSGVIGVASGEIVGNALPSREFSVKLERFNGDREL